MPAARAPRASITRLIDANANRALEGLRVCEEIVRFHLESAPVFPRLRSLRHAVAHAVGRLPLSATELARARDSRRDLGRGAPASRVASLERLLLINFHRAKESLRTLEECSRVIAPPIRRGSGRRPERSRGTPRRTAAFQRLRFRIYEVERETLLRVDALRHR